MLTLEYANNPVYSSESGDAINLIVKWQEFNEEHYFNATSYDSMAHGVDLYNRAKAGEFGTIGTYVPIYYPPDEPQPTTTGSQTL